MNLASRIERGQELTIFPYARIRFWQKIVFLILILMLSTLFVA